MLFHIVNGIHLSLIALDFNQRRVIHSTCGQLNELISCLTSLMESLKIVHSQSVCVGSLSQSATVCRFTTRDGRGVLFHLHGVSPISFTLEDEDLEILSV